MAVILPLQHTAELASVYSLLDITHDSSQPIASNQVKLLNANYYASVSEKILTRIAKYYQSHLTDRLLLALAPPSLKELRIDSCSCVTALGVIGVFHKCRHLQLIDLSRCDHLVSVSLFESISAIPDLALSAIIVEECELVTNQVVQCILRGIPNLKQLKLGSCRNLTDSVFLVDKPRQLGLENSSVVPMEQEKDKIHDGESSRPFQFVCRLVSVDVSGCKLTSTAIRHLATLTGPTLRDVDISCSKIDSLALLYLSGYSFPTAIRVLLTMKPDQVTVGVLEKRFQDMKDQVLTSWNSSQSRCDHITVKPSSVTKNKLICDLKHSSGVVETSKSLTDQSPLLKCKQTSDNDQSKFVCDWNDLGSVLQEKCQNSNDQSVLPKDKQTLSIDQSQPVIDTDTVEGALVEDCKSRVDLPLSTSEQTKINQSGCMLDLNDLHIVSERDRNKIIPSLSSEVKLHGLGTDKEQLPLSARQMGGGNADQSLTNKKDMSQKKKMVDTDSPVSDCLNPDEISLDLYVGEDEKSQSSHTSCQQTMSSNELKDGLHNNASVDQLGLPTQVQSLNSNQSQSVIDHGQDKIDFETNALKKSSDQSLCLTQKQALSINQSECASDLNQQMSTNNIFAFTDDLMAEPVNFPPRLVNKKVDVKVNLDNSNQMKNNQQSGSVAEEPVNKHISHNAHKHEHSNTKFSDKTEEYEIKPCSEAPKNRIKNCEINDLHSKEQPSHNSCDGPPKSIQTIPESIVKVDKSDKTDNSESIVNVDKSDKTDDNSESIVKVDKSDKTDNSDENEVYLKLRPFNRLFSSDITSFSACHTSFSDSVCNRVCVRAFFLLNRNLKSLELWGRSMVNVALGDMATRLSDLRYLSLVDCDNVDDQLLRTVGLKCQKLEKLDLKGVCFFDDAIPSPFLGNGCLNTLSVSESHVTDITMHVIRRVASSRIVDLDFSWCEEITEEGVNVVASSCSALRVLNLRHCPATDVTLDLLADHCPLLENVELSGVQDITDIAVVHLVSRLPLLQVIDISWNFALTDPSVMALFRCCPLLKEAKLSGLKYLTSDAFTPIISDYPQIRKCQNLYKFEKQERQLLEEMDAQQFSSDEEYEAIYLPHRSMVYAPSLQRLELEYCNYIEDDKLQEIVAICRGSLTIIDYYCEKVVPSL